MHDEYGSCVCRVGGRLLLLDRGVSISVPMSIRMTLFGRHTILI
jgi:hypothetical protein